MPRARNVERSQLLEPSLDVAIDLGVQQELIGDARQRTIVSGTCARKDEPTAWSEASLFKCNIIATQRMADELLRFGYGLRRAPRTQFADRRASPVVSHGDDLLVVG
jgi:hypothetical protein